MLLRLMIIDKKRSRHVTVRVPDMGLTSHEWATAVFAATHSPMGVRFHAPGSREVASALWQLETPTEALGVGDGVSVHGHIVWMVRVDGDTPTFTAAEPLPAPPGPAMYVSADVAPPEAVAYVEDNRDRLWTGRGLGEWRCLTDPVGRTVPLMWAGVWRDHGPLTPLVPVERLDEPEAVEWTPPHRDVLPPGRAHSDAAGPFG